MLTNALIFWFFAAAFMLIGFCIGRWWDEDCEEDYPPEDD